LIFLYQEKLATSKKKLRGKSRLEEERKVGTLAFGNFLRSGLNYLRTDGMVYIKTDGSMVQ